MRVRLRGLTTGALALAAIGCAGSVLVPLVPAWPCTLFEHFRLQYLLGGLLVVAGCAALRMRGWFDVALVAALINAWWVLPDLSRSTRELPGNGSPVRVLLLNVHTSSSAFAEVARLIDDTKPDIVGLVEVDERWLAQLTPALARFPHRITAPRDDNFGIALFAATPMTGAAEPIGYPVPTIVATVDLHGRALALVLTHPIPPVRAASLADHTAHLDAVATRVGQLAAPKLLMGDFNATPWSRPFRDLVGATGLCDTRAGFGLQASFPASLALLRIPIDHVLVSCDVGVRRRAIERDVGSDHLPVVVDLSL
jgi:endonuclease/exonuclease/phosphatase (EEP) superfamily protein YafD